MTETTAATRSRDVWKTAPDGGRGRRRGRRRAACVGVGVGVGESGWVCVQGVGRKTHRKRKARERDGTKEGRRKKNNQDEEVRGRWEEGRASYIVEGG